MTSNGALALGVTLVIAGGPWLCGPAVALSVAKPGTPLRVFDEAERNQRLGSLQRGHWLRGSEDGRSWEHRAAGLAVRIESHGGVQISAGSEALGLQLESWGWEGEERAAPVQAIRAGENRVEFARGERLVEWYVNGPLGLQHGFSVLGPPERSARRGLSAHSHSDLERGSRVEGDPPTDSQLVFRLAFHGAAEPRLSQNRSEVRFEGEGITAFSYGPLAAFDRTGRVLPAWFELRDSALELRVDVRAAEFPVVIDPFLQAGVLLPSVPEQNLMLGRRSIAVDGDVVVVGAPFLGRVYVYQRTPGGWGTMTEVARLSMSDSVQADWTQFGASVAIEGDTIVVGAPAWRASGSSGGNDKGAVFVYQKPAGGWQDMTETARLTSSDPARYDSFGAAVAIVGDTIFVGSPSHDWGDSDINANYGAVYVFVRSGTNWTTTNSQTAKLGASDREARDEFGFSVAASGNTLVVGAPGKSIGGQSVGTAYVFERAAGGWASAVQAAKLRPSAAVDSEGFGKALGVTGDTVVVGAPDRHNLSVRPARYYEGAAYVFKKPAAGWAGEVTESARLQVSDAKAEDSVGWSVAIWSGKVLAGIPFYGNALTGNARGAVAIFEEPAGGWSGLVYESSKLTPEDPVEGDRFGHTVAASGPVVVVGAPYRDDGALRDVGRAYVFEEQVLCASTPRTGCKQITTGKGAPMLLFSKGPSDVQQDRAIFRWSPGAATDLAEFGNPLSDRTYFLCIYDETSTGFRLIVDTTALPGGTCAGRPCWRMNRTGSKYLYRNPELTPDGMLRLDLISGPDRKARLVAVAKGARAGIPALPLQQNSRVVAQIVNDLGTCWSAEFQAPARVNSTGKFRDND